MIDLRSSLLQDAVNGDALAGLGERIASGGGEQVRRVLVLGF
jgi:hypothetical protein